MGAGRLRTVLERLESGAATLRGDGRGWALLAIAYGWFLVLGLRFVVPALLPTITADFGISNATAGLAITLLWVTYAAMQFPAGALGDRFGERRLLVVSTLGATIGIGVFAVSVSFAIFLVATVVFGLTTGLYGPSRGTALARLYHASGGAAFGTVLAAGSVGAAVLPPAAALGTDLVGWRGALALSAPGFLLAALALWWAVPERDGHTEPDESTGPSDVRTTVALRRALGTRPVVLAVLGTSLMLFVFQGLSAFFTTYLVTEKGLTEPTAGALFGLLFLCGALSQWRGGTMADRYGHRRVLSVVSILSVLPLLALPVVGGLVPLVLVAVLLGVRLSIDPIANAYVVTSLPATVRGTAWGAIRTGMFAVSSFGSTLVGAMADADLFTEAIVLLAVLTAVAGELYRRLPARRSS